MTTDKKILIAYYSKTGNTERVANDIASRLGADVEKIIDLKKRTGILGYILGGRDAMKHRLTEIAPSQKDPANYDLVILGTPVWGWNATPAITSYIDGSREKIKNVAFFLTSGGTELEKIIPYLEEISGKKPHASAGFNRKELKDQVVYGQKLDKFVAAIKS